MELENHYNVTLGRRRHPSLGLGWQLYPFRHLEFG